MVQRRLKLLAATIAIVMMALSALGVTATAQSLSIAPIAGQAKVTDRDGKVCVKFRAPIPNQKKCHHTTVSTSATRRSSSDDPAPSVLPVATVPSYPRGGYGRQSIGVPHVLSSSPSHQRRAPFWAVFAFAQQLRN